MIKINIIYEESIFFLDRLLFKTNLESILFYRNVSSESWWISVAVVRLYHTIILEVNKSEMLETLSHGSHIDMNQQVNTGVIND